MADGRALPRPRQLFGSRVRAADGHSERPACPRDACAVALAFLAVAPLPPVAVRPG
jgi:hypothetical protein